MDEDAAVTPDGFELVGFIQIQGSMKPVWRPAGGAAEARTSGAGAAAAVRPTRAGTGAGAGRGGASSIPDGDGASGSEPSPAAGRGRARRSPAASASGRRAARARGSPVHDSGAQLSAELPGRLLRMYRREAVKAALEATKRDAEAGAEPGKPPPAKRTRLQREGAGQGAPHTPKTSDGSGAGAGAPRAATVARKATTAQKGPAKRNGRRVRAKTYAELDKLALGDSPKVFGVAERRRVPAGTFVELLHGRKQWYRGKVVAWRWAPGPDQLGSCFKVRWDDSQETYVRLPREDEGKKWLRLISGAPTDRVHTQEPEDEGSTASSAESSSSEGDEDDEEEEDEEEEDESESSSA